MKLFIVVLLYLFQKQNAIHIEEYEIEAVGVLTEQLFIAASNYISECNLVPVEKSCQHQNRTMNITKGQDLINILVWNKKGDIVENLSKSKYKTLNLPKVKEDIVTLVHDMGESSCSLRMKNLISNAYLHKPEAFVISIDYSSIVRYFNS